MIESRSLSLVGHLATRSHTTANPKSAIWRLVNLPSNSKIRPHHSVDHISTRHDKNVLTTPYMHLGTSRFLTRPCLPPSRLHPTYPRQVISSSQQQYRNLAHSRFFITHTPLERPGLDETSLRPSQTFQRRLYRQETGGKEAERERPKQTKDQHDSDGFGPDERSVQSTAPKEKLLLDRLQDLSGRFHRPTKEELLAAATGFWSRMRIRFKWFSIRSLRPFNLDDLSAFFTWIVAGHVLWIIMGTTTFFSLVILAVNTVFAQETLASWVGNYMTQSSGVKVVFESAIVPRWKDGVITFKNVFISRRPGSQKSAVQKGSQTSAQAAAAAAALAEKAEAGEDEDTNYTQFDLSIDTVNVTLSFTKWWNGKGLLRDVEMKGVRGVVDRTSVRWSESYEDPRIYRHEHAPGDFELESFKLDDLLVSVYQPANFRPFSVSIFSAHLPRLRKQWLFYDFLAANHVSGSFDDSPFFIHPRQSHGHSGPSLQQGDSREGDEGHWKKQSRIRIDGLNIDHLNRGVEGPFSWIRQGEVDIVADVLIPAENDESITKVMSDFYERMEATVTSNKYLTLNSFTVDNSNVTVPPVLHSNGSNERTEQPKSQKEESDHRFLIMDLRVHLNEVKAAVPIFNNDLSYANNALIRPIVAYINSHRSFIPITCRVVKRASEFDGSWTVFDSGLMEDLSRETYEAFAKDVVDEQARRRRIKKVGLWSLQLAIQAILVGLAGGVA